MRGFVCERVFVVRFSCFTPKCDFPFFFCGHLAFFHAEQVTKGVSNCFWVSWAQVGYVTVWNVCHVCVCVHKSFWPVTPPVTGGVSRPGGRGSKFYVLSSEPKEHKSFCPDTRPGGPVTRLTGKSFMCKSFMCKSFMCLFCSLKNTLFHPLSGVIRAIRFTRSEIRVIRANRPDAL